MLTKEHKQKMIEARLLEYESRLFSLEMDLIASEAAGDTAGVRDTQKNIDTLKKAYGAVKGMRTDADTTDTTA
jgi:hypothetical protein